ncbi:MAG: 7,8-didemethyl-8-hydroxy-5-deazariboflavin synthase subunit CofG [Merismopediaceae bacterium]|nr:7,8-didemethyl-8-hydroxy-5-deazariboflavin synthase subunit CofG [Merismopediaceae bacterium]
MARTITYSPAYTLVPTYECFNRCEYCNFRVNPGQDQWLSLSKAQHILANLKNQGITEILILSGEVEPRSPRRSAWLEHIYQLGKLALELGFFPHTNAGPLSYAEMAHLKSVNVSLGLMVEQITPKLLTTVHRHAPSKQPHKRLEQLRWAGQLKIPFTTGILLGIGETASDWWDSLTAIADIHRQYQHIQEVILQPYSPGEKQTWQGQPFNIYQFPQIITQARAILPPEIVLQIPPNLIPNPELLLACLAAGARDLGGISPLDEVNPTYPHFSQTHLTQILQQDGWELVPRLPVYPSYYPWVHKNLSPLKRELLPQI